MRFPAAIYAMMVLVAPPLFAAEKQQVGIEQIDKEFELIGRLGAPLGKVVSVTATYDPNARGPVELGGQKDFQGTHVIRVTKVDGQDLPVPVEIYPQFATASGELRNFPTDRSFECRGRELGGFANAFALFEDSSVQFSGKFGFYTSFSVLEAWATDEAKPVKKLKPIKVTEISKSIDLVGRLGIPIGKGITVTAIFDPEHQPPGEKGIFGGRPDRLLRVTRINGTDLPLPVVILSVQSSAARSEPAFPINTPFECRGCEFYLTGPEEFCGDYQRTDNLNSRGPGSLLFLSRKSGK